MSKPPNIHPDAPAGGGGIGFFRSSMPLGLNPDFDVFDNPLPLGVEPVLLADAGDKGAAPAETAPAAKAETTDPDIEALNLVGAAKKGAYALKKEHSSVVFTSGFRTTEDQARAMAENVAASRSYIKDTYQQSTARDKCQKWVDDNPDKKTKEEIQKGLKSVMDDLTDSQLNLLSKHLSGEAFDVQPVTIDADKIKKTIKGLAGLTKFLEKESGLTRWHAQF